MTKLIFCLFLISHIFSNLTLGFRVTFDNLTFVMDRVEPLKDNTVFHKDFPDKCYFSPTEQTWNIGEHWSPKNKCWIARCVKPGVAIVFSCGNVSPAIDGHTNKYCQSIGMDLNRPYPKCCNRFLCKSLNTRPYIYNPVVAGGDRELPNFKTINKRNKSKRPYYKIIIGHNDTCRLNKYSNY